MTTTRISALAMAASMAAFSASASAQDAPAGNEVAEPAVEDGSPGFDLDDSVFDETWVTVGAGGVFSTSYSGSDDYQFSPVPLVLGRVGGIGITPNAAGLSLDLLSEGPDGGPSGTSFSFGPTFRIRSDRTGSFEDEVVERAGELDTALEVGAQAGVTIPQVLHQYDSLSFSAAARWDVLDAHNGMVVEPAVTYRTPLSRGAAVQLIASASFVDDDFADYYYSISPEQSAATGLAQYSAEGGLNSIGINAIGTIDLDNNLLNGGFAIFAIGGYSRLMGDAADTPFTSVRGSADQFVGGLGVGYTF